MDMQLWGTPCIFQREVLLLDLEPKQTVCTFLPHGVTGLSSEKQVPTWTTISFICKNKTAFLAQNPLLVPTQPLTLVPPADPAHPACLR